MRYAFVSDVHANLPAWNAVLTDIYSLGVSRIVCLGDVVGYGPQPAEVLGSMYSRVHHFLLGNHDAVLCGKTDPACFNERARANIEWTGTQLDAKARAFFAELPFVIEGDGFRCAHASPVEPELFPYVTDSAAADRVFAGTAEPLVLVGHSHVPCVFRHDADGRTEMGPARDFRLQPGCRYLVNAGSVGQPRNGDVRAGYCLYDTDDRSVTFRQVPFDLAAYADALEASALPAKKTYFLRVALNVDPGPFRESPDFRPPDRAPCNPADVGVLDLRKAVRAARAWKVGALVLALCLAGAIGEGVRRGRGGEGGMAEFPALRAGAVPAPEVGSLCFVPPTPRERVPGGQSFGGWTVCLEDPDAQTVIGIVPENPGGDAELEPAFRVEATSNERFAIRSRPVPVQAGMRMRITARFLAEEIPEGHLELVLLEEHEDASSSRILLHYPVANLKPGVWKFVRKSTPAGGLPRDARIRLCLQGQIRGGVTVRTLNLERIE